ncbi:hypothetical protein EW026_g6440 [Hermanssonia centrifuga]|uniref:Uncharacterized protein n=1 Tax=Hermanssonia centrifuga TaxID=98765 RepID=A0A4S4KB04_9APHY|nr:hypothetical protein EW026_g6440 [Hermanssonia centrifuga]
MDTPVSVTHDDGIDSLRFADPHSNFKLKDTPLNQRPTDSQAMLNFAKATPQQSNLDDTPGKQQPISTALRPTRSHCNTLIPIARLPFDIMARIFADILHALRWNMPEVVALATVCQDWYSTMLDAPYLWSHIDFDQPEFVQPFIQRSCNSPLHILDRGPRMSIMDICISFSPTGPAYSKPTPPSMIDLEPYTHRIQTLDLSLTSSCLQHLLKIIRLSPILPQLKQLRITHRQNRDRDAQLHINAMAVDTKIISPFLDTMILTDMIWHASSYANLRKLSLTFNNPEFTSSQVLDYVNSILTQSPRLQDLCVRFWNDPRGQTKSHFPTLSLPLLKNLPPTNDCP